MSHFVYNDIELTVDLADADFVDAVSAAFEEATAAEKDLPKVGTAGEKIRATCAMFKDFFDNIYGEGTADKLFDGKSNLNACRDAFKDFLVACVTDSEASAQADQGIMDIIKPYTAEGRKTVEIKHRQSYAQKYGKH